MTVTTRDIALDERRFELKEGEAVLLYKGKLLRLKPANRPTANVVYVDTEELCFEEVVEQGTLHDDHPVSHHFRIAEPVAPSAHWEDA